jgi:hypothetical protein
MNTEIMVDIETLGTRPGSVILSIGAVKFFENSIVDEFYVKIDPEDCQVKGMTIEAGTIKWWMKQSVEAQGEMFGGQRVGIADALMAFALFVEEDQPVWGNGSDFDNAHLAAAFHLLNIDFPWSFWNNRCYRTAKASLPEVKMVRPGVHHNAISDARYQAVCLMAMRRAEKEREKIC